MNQYYIYNTIVGRSLRIFKIDSHFDLICCSRYATCSHNLVYSTSSVDVLNRFFKKIINNIYPILTHQSSFLKTIPMPIGASKSISTIIRTIQLLSVSTGGFACKISLQFK